MKGFVRKHTGNEYVISWSMCGGLIGFIYENGVVVGEKTALREPQIVNTGSTSTRELGP